MKIAGSAEWAALYLLPVFPRSLFYWQTWNRSLAKICVLKRPWFICFQNFPNVAILPHARAEWHRKHCSSFLVYPVREDLQLLNVTAIEDNAPLPTKADHQDDNYAHAGRNVPQEKSNSHNVDTQEERATTGSSKTFLQIGCYALKWIHQLRIEPLLFCPSHILKLCNMLIAANHYWFSWENRRSVFVVDFLNYKIFTTFHTTVQNSIVSCKFIWTFLCHTKLNLGLLSKNVDWTIWEISDIHLSSIYSNFEK